MPAYTPTTWVDGVTPVNAANLNKIEAELVDTDTSLGAYLPIDSVVPAATRVQANKLVAGDTQPAFRFLGSGKLEWGPGGSTAPDTTLYRSAAGILATDGQINAKGGTGFVYNPATAAGSALWVQVTGETQPRFNINYGGVLSWGPGGAAATDITLYRSAAGTLKTTGTHIVGQLQGEGDVWAQYGLATQVRMGNNSGRPTIDFGSAFDTSFYRSAANTLRANGPLEATAFNVVSDARYKKDIRPLPSTWEAVKQLSPVSYRWRDKDTFRDDGRDHVGFIAQDVQQPVPSSVTSSLTADGKDDPAQPLTMNTLDIVATLTKALQEAMARIEALEGVTPTQGVAA